MERAVSKLKHRKAPGLDGLMAEHLQVGGHCTTVWLVNILNAGVELEAVSDVWKNGILVPVYKGGGKDPLLMNNYQGVALTSTVGKVLEFLILGRLSAVFKEAGIPHVNQTAFRKAASFEDAISATQEAIAKYLREATMYS